MMPASSRVLRFAAERQPNRPISNPKMLMMKSGASRVRGFLTVRFAQSPSDNPLRHYSKCEMDYSPATPALSRPGHISEIDQVKERIVAGSKA